MEETGKVRFSMYAHKMLLQALVDRCLRESESGTIDDFLTVLNVALSKTQNADFFIQTDVCCSQLSPKEIEEIAELLKEF
jgi:hypothetical protein